MDLGRCWNYRAVHHPAQGGEVMGWRWWKSFGFGPLRTTLSNRGIGWNIGTSFLRFGVGPSGAQYILVRIPGTGIGFIKYLGHPFQRQVHTATINTVTTSTLPNNVPPQPLTRNQEILAAIKRQSP
jgi:hypothetical protein